MRHCVVLSSINSTKVLRAALDERLAIDFVKVPSVVVESARFDRDGIGRSFGLTIDTGAAFGTEVWGVKLSRVGSIAKGFGLAVGDSESSPRNCDVYGEGGASGLSRIF